MTIFRDAFLDKEWEDSTRREVLSMTQGQDSFWNFSIRIQAKNFLLKGTNSHLDNVKLRQQIEARLDDRLSKKCKAEKVNKVVNFRDWLAEVYHVDNNLAEDRREWEAYAKAAHETTWRNFPLSEPSRRFNTQSATSTSSSVPRVLLLKLMDSERTLLSANDGCFKCRTFFANHRSAACKNESLAAVGYKTLSQADVDKAKCSRPSSSKPVAVIQPVSDDENSPYIHPIAAILGSSANAYGYTASNVSSVITGSHNGSESDPDVSFPSPPPSHLYWKCAAMSTSHPTLFKFKALIDNGSHTVLINNKLTTKLGLRRRFLQNPQTVQLAMNSNRQKTEIVL
jgi:hypothetical protein